MLEMKLATCEAVMGVLPESTDSLKTSYLSRESTYRLVIVDFELREVRYALIALYRRIRSTVEKCSNQVLDGG